MESENEHSLGQELKHFSLNMYRDVQLPINPFLMALNKLVNLYSRPLDAQNSIRSLISSMFNIPEGITDQSFPESSSRIMLNAMMLNTPNLLLQNRSRSAFWEIIKLFGFHSRVCCFEQTYVDCLQIPGVRNYGCENNAL